MSEPPSATPSTPSWMGATNPFSSQSLEYRHERHLASASSPQNTQILPTNEIPIQRLNTDGLSCRLLLLSRMAGHVVVSAGSVESIILEGTGNQKVQCTAITQTSEDAICEIISPIRCKFYFAIDNILMNGEGIVVEELADQSHELEQRDFENQSTHTLAPGFWRLKTPEGALDLRIYSRQHSLDHILHKTSPLAGSKRLASNELKITTKTTSTIIHQLDTVAELGNGETARFTFNNECYTIFCLKVRPTHRLAARVFDARHSDYPGKVIIVKTIPTVHGAKSAILSWQREYNIHRQLQSDNIAQLLGGDARLGSLYLQKIDAFDLSRQEWCNREDKFFRGTRHDAIRVLADMASALEYLSQKDVLHNDIKPANILYGKETGAVLIDFGLGTSSGSPASSGGTPWYVPPEYLGMGERKAPADVWALGIVLIYLLKMVSLPDSQLLVKEWRIRNVGHNPSAEESMSAWLSIVRQAVNKLSNETGDDVEVTRIVVQMLNTHPETRIGATELVAAIQDLNESFHTGFEDEFGKRSFSRSIAE